MKMLLLSPQDVLRQGLEYVNVNYRNKKSVACQVRFQQHYGSSPIDIAAMWYDIQNEHLPKPNHKDCPQKYKQWVNLKEEEKSYRGFKMFMISHYFMWVYDKNSALLSSRFNICEPYCRGEHIWKWIVRIAALKKLKIYFPKSVSNPKMENFVYTIDGVDCETREIKHKKYNIDQKACSHKFNHCAAKYELAISVFHAQCCSINGPYKGGEHDLSMFCQGKMKDEMKRLSVMGKKAIVDRGYKNGADSDESKYFSFPDLMDTKDLHSFKTRARLRHETFNGRLKMFNILQKRFRHNFDIHVFAFEAVVVTVQYQMDNGSPIFAV